MSKDKITALVPSTMNEAHELAKVYAASQLLPAELRNKPADVFVTIMAGMELGMAPMAALRSIHIIKGQPVLSADAMVACAQSSGACEYFRAIESNNRIATYETKRKGSEPVQRSFTIDDARTAGLLSNPTWKKYPAAMLRARCKADLARDVYPDAVAGTYIHDEARDFSDHNGTPSAPPGADPDIIDAEVVEAPSQEECDAMLRRVESAETLDALQALTEECRRFSGEDRQVLLKAYQARKHDLSQAEGVA